MCLLQEAAKTAEMGEQDFFRAVCAMENITGQRFDALWSGWQTEEFIPDFMERYCLRLVLGNEGTVNGAD